MDEPGDREQEHDPGGHRRLARREGVQPEQEQVQDDDGGHDRPAGGPDQVGAAADAVVGSAATPAALAPAALTAPSVLDLLPIWQLHLVHVPLLVSVGAIVAG